MGKTYQLDTLKQERDLACSRCELKHSLNFEISMAFQPIVNILKGAVFANEALVRGIHGENAGKVFEKVDNDNLYAFDQTCRLTALELASKIDSSQLLSINFMPNAIYKPELCIRATIKAAEEYGFPIQNIMFEITENEKITNVKQLKEIVRCYKDLGFLTAIDDFGAGYSGLNLLSELNTDYIKIDLELIRNIHLEKTKQIILNGILQVCEELGIKVIAEGIEQYDEASYLFDSGIYLMQGYYFSEPVFEDFSQIDPQKYVISPHYKNIATL